MTRFDDGAAPLGLPHAGVAWGSSEDGLALYDLEAGTNLGASVDVDAEFGFVVAPRDGSGVDLGGETLAPIDEELVAPTLVVTLPWDTGTRCSKATVVLPGTSTDNSALLAGAVVVATGEEEDCSDLAVPLVSVQEKGRQVDCKSGDLNGDGFGDMVLEGADGERSIWLSAGDGGELDTTVELPDWTEAAVMRGVAPGVGQPASTVFLASWAAILD